MTAPVLTLALAFGACTLLWLLSLRLGDVSIIDIFWAPGIALMAWTAAAAAMAIQPRGWLALALASLWGLRLGLHILLRHAGEDHRYGEMRKKFGPRWWWWSLFQVFWLQALLLWIVSWPLQAAVAAAQPLTVVDAVGAALAAAGLLIEGLADYQLTRFRADAANAGKVMDRGLWSWSRHPNYFGDTLMWWGFFVLGFAGSHAWWLLVSPVVMTALLLRVSGVSLLEETIAERRPGYADYVRRTSAFFPWPPRRPS
jgi:steroid 5-alpha reductase family enzyme